MIKKLTRGKANEAFLKDNFVRSSLLLIAFTLALVANLIRGFSESHSPDSFDYLTQGGYLSQNLSWIFANPDKFTKPLGLPVLVGLFDSLLGSNGIVGLKLLFCSLHAATVLLAYKICLLLLIQKRIALICALVIAADPLILMSTSDVMTETFATFSITFWVYWALLKFNRIEIDKSIKFSFVLSSIATITMRPNFFFVLLGIILVVAVFSRPNLSGIGVEVGVTFLILLIYEVGVSVFYGGFIFLAPGSGLGIYFFCKGNLIPQSLGVISSEKNSELNMWVLQSLKNQGELFFQHDQGSSMIDFNRFLTESAISYCLANPIEGGLTILARIFGIWRPYLAFGAYPPIIFLFVSCILMLFAFYFIKFTLKSKDQLERFFYYLFLSSSIMFTFSVLVTPAQARHRIAFSETLQWIIVFLVFSAKRNAKNEKMEIEKSI